MIRQQIEFGASLTFSDYFKLNVEIDELLAYFGYSFEFAKCNLPTTQIEPSRTQNLHTRLEQSFSLVGFTNETARREFLIAPVLLEVALQTHAKIRVEYALEVTEQLRGTLDYYLQARNNLLVVEAKNADLQKGFTQLAVELIALNQIANPDLLSLYGAVSIGDIWRFGVLNRQAKQVTQDLTLYRVPTDLADLLAILVAILVEP
ncbi:MAG: hypothetical protein M3Q45_15480 [Chloroflexota bacterium]|nr:hypothetical protein [Chloroflexota bacterium]